VELNSSRFEVDKLFVESNRRSQHPRDNRHFNTYKATTHQSGMLAIKVKGKRRGKLREIGSSSVQ
jgi:hypothetical protein